jgi:hypothetical protein
MVGGVAVQGNLLCVTWSAARGHVFLFDLEAQQRVSAWTMPVGPQGYSDAAGVAMDEHYHLFVADPHNDRVCHFSAFGRSLGEFGQPAPAQGDAGRDRPGVLDRPHAVALRGDLLYVACGDAPRRRGVQRFSRQGTVLKPLASRGDPEAKFGAPRGLWADADGVLVADTLRGVLQRFRGDGTFLGEVACAEAGELARPIAVARLPNGSLLIAERGDRTGVRLLGVDGRVLSGGSDLQQHCIDPIGFATDRRGNVYVLDRLGERVLQFGADLTFVRIVIDLAELLDDAPGNS